MFYMRLRTKMGKSKVYIVVLYKYIAIFTKNHTKNT